MRAANPSPNQRPAGTARLNGGRPLKTVPVRAQQPLESWQFLKQWADRRGWGSWRCAGAMILAATPEERQRFPDQRVLSGYWRRWLKGEHLPDAHMSDPNVRGFYRPIIARMTGSSPEEIWPARSSMASELKDQRDRTAGLLAGTRAKLDDLRRQVQLIPQLEDDIAELEAKLAYFNAILAVPVPGQQKRRAIHA